MYVLKKEALFALFPKTKKEVLEKYIDPLNKTFEKFKFDSSLSVRSFVAQVGHESAGFNAVQENLNYSEQALLKVFGKYFTPSQAKQYSRKPEKIANRVYANRMGNGDEKSGDGWRYRGRGVLQITGKNNYSSLAKFLDMTLEEVTKYLETPEGAVIAAGWFFAQNGLMSLANTGSMTALTKRINGGTNGLDDRLDIFARSKALIKD